MNTTLTNAQAEPVKVTERIIKDMIEIAGKFPGDKNAVRCDVGESVLRAMKALPKFSGPGTPGTPGPDVYLGMPVKLNNILPPFHFVFFNCFGDVVGMGSIDPQDSWTRIIDPKVLPTNLYRHSRDS